MGKLSPEQIFTEKGEFDKQNIVLKNMNSD